MRINGVRYSQVFARILENAGKLQMVTLVTAQVNFRKRFKAVLTFLYLIILGNWTGKRCDVHKLKCWPGENRGPCGKHGECRYDHMQDLHYCACHLWWKGLY